MTIISYQDWYDAGRTRRGLERALSTGELRRLRRGVLTDATVTQEAAAEHRLRIRASAISLGPRAYFSHFSAAVLHGLPLMPVRLREVTVVRTGGGHGSIHPTIHARAGVLTPAEIIEIDGVGVTSLVRTACDLARLLPFPEGVMLLDAALRAGCEREELHARTQGGRGCRIAARAIAFSDGDAESPGESLSRVRMFEAGLAMPALQVPIFDDTGQFVGRSDFYWDHARAVGEFDGRVKYDELVESRSDLAKVVMAEKQREQAIRDTGIQVVRWTWPDLWDGAMIRRLTPVVGLAPSPNALVSVERLYPSAGVRPQRRRSGEVGVSGWGGWGGARGVSR